MAFQTKDFLSITASAVNHVRATCRKITDFNVGSVIRTLLETFAIELDELYQQMVNGLREAIPVATYTSFGFAAREAERARGPVRVTAAASIADRLIPAGARFVRSDQSGSYESTTDVVLRAGATFADVPVVCREPGPAGNIAAGTGLSMLTPPEGVISAAALTDLAGGLEGESPGERKARFAAFIASLQRGTLAAIEYGLKEVTVLGTLGEVRERVTSVAIIEPFRTDPTAPIANVQAYIYNGVGTSSPALLARAVEVMRGYRDKETGKKVAGYVAAGVNLELRQATLQQVPITAAVEVRAEADMAELELLARSAIATVIFELDIGGNFRRAAAIAAAMAIPGVANVRISSPSDDVLAAPSVKLMPGAITLTAGPEVAE